MSETISRNVIGEGRVESNDRTLLIHLGDDHSNGHDPGRVADESSSCLYDRHVLPWYCQWAHEFARRVYVLLPYSLQDQSAEVVSHLRDASVLWYAEDGLGQLPLNGNRGDVWVVNGHQLPMVDWRLAGTAIRRRRTDVLIFGQQGAGITHHYPESVMVGDKGEVVRFKRHYSDSPEFTDVCAQEASFLVSSAEHANAVVNHMILRGWGLDSVGAMTRRFQVRWSPNGCVLWEAAIPGTVGSISGESIVAEGRGNPASQADSSDSPYSFPSNSKLDLQFRNPAPPSTGTVPTQVVSSRDVQSAKRTGSPRRQPVAARSTPTPMGNPESLMVQEDADNDHKGDKRVYLFWKRVMDVTLTLISLIALAPLFVVVAILVKCTSRGPVFFAHTRQGMGGKEFPCLKFRSMRSGAEAMQDKLRGENEVDGPQFKIEHDPRLTKLGKWIRQTNIDELPQLFNVLVGHMSLVGPRPSPDKENQFCPSWRRARLSVKPGVTGLWQIMRLRDQEQSDFQEWIYYDVEYARHQSLWLDWQIILYTPVSIFAPAWVKDLAKQLRKRGICAYSAWLEEPPVATHHPSKLLSA